MTAEFEPVVASPRILAGTRADLQLKCYRDGVLATPTGTLTCTVTDATGTTVATPTVTASGGVLTATLTAAQTATVNLLTVAWAGMVFDGEPVMSYSTTYETVGDLLFTLIEARTADPEGKMKHEDRFKAEDLLQHRDRITDEFEQILGYSLGRRYKREIFSGDDTSTLWLYDREVWTIRAVETLSGSTWTAFTSDELSGIAAYPNGLLARRDGYWTSGERNVRIGYESGLQPIPLALKRAALIVLRSQAFTSALPSRAISEANQFGNITLATPGLRGSHYGLPEVDKVLNDWTRKLPGVA